MITLIDALVEYTTRKDSKVFHNQTYSEGKLYLNINVINDKNPIRGKYRNTKELIGRVFGYYFYGSKHVRMKVTATDINAGFVSFQFRAPLSGYNSCWASHVYVNKDEFFRDLREIESLCKWCI